jgi:transcription elongation factor Elf1
MARRPSIDFRNQARSAATRAREMLNAATDLPSLRYAALEVRLAMEALTYDRAQAYRAELPLSEIGTWQPRRVLMTLIEINPRADSGGTVRVGRQASRGERAAEADMHTLGTEVVLDLRFLRRHYDAIGSYLHTPTMLQQEAQATQDPARLRRRVREVLDHLDKVLASRIFNIIPPSPFTWITCGRCGDKVRRSTRNDVKRTAATCLGCGAHYNVIRQKDGTYRWWSHDVRIPCQARDCDGEIIAPADLVKRGSLFDCPKCGATNRVVLSARLARPTEVAGDEA